MGNIYQLNKGFLYFVRPTIAGRTTDTSIYAALPIAAGFDPGLAWHAGKLLECGAASTQEFAPGDCIVVTLEEDCFYVEPMNPNLHHTPVSVAAHSFYENGSPFHLYEPGGMMDLTDCKYEAVSDRKVKVSGSHWMVDLGRYCRKGLKTAPEITRGCRRSLDQFLHQSYDSRNLGSNFSRPSGYRKSRCFDE